MTCRWHFEISQSSVDMMGLHLAETSHEDIEQDSSMGIFDEKLVPTSPTLCENSTIASMKSPTVLSSK